MFIFSIIYSSAILVITKIWSSHSLMFQLMDPNLKEDILKYFRISPREDTGKQLHNTAQILNAGRIWESEKDGKH